MNDAIQQMRRFFALTGALVVSAAMVMAALVLGPHVEQRAAPVWTTMTIEWAGQQAGYLYGYKDRGTCRLLEVAAFVRRGNIWRRAEIKIDGRTPGFTSRPTGWQSLGVWTFSEHGDRLKITAHFACHALWATPATLGEWPMPGATQ